MEQRKLIKFGNSSFIMSLPSYWIKKHKLGKGDSVFFEEDKDSHLVICPEPKKKKPIEKRIIVDITNKNIEGINRELISAYINNYNVIKVIGKDIEKKASEVIKALQNLMAIEIMEQTKDKVVAKNFIIFDEISLNEIIRRIDMILRCMLEDSKQTFRKDLTANLSQRDEDINRLVFLCYRTILLYTENPELVKDKQNFGVVDYLRYWQMCLLLEEIADATKRIARSMKELKVDDKKKEEIIKQYTEVEKYYLNVLKSYYNRDRNFAFELAGERSELIKKYETLQAEPGVGIREYSIFEGFKLIITLTRNISRVIYDLAPWGNDVLKKTIK